MAENLVRLIAQAKPKTILLTSFTFGLSYFEAAILPTLLRHGCSNVSVLVDYGQYQASLGELHSNFAGRSYRICPVRAPGGGIFHPKLAYFDCEGSDILMVASGNLTFTGQGGHLECLDAVRSDDAPEIFEEASSFFESLAPVNERLYGSVFPGINNVVRYIRIYSLLCWATWRFEDYLHKNASSLTTSEVTDLFKGMQEKVELLVTWANIGRNGVRGLVGTRRNFPNNNKQVALRFDAFGSNEAAYMSAVQYRPSITNGLGFLEIRQHDTFACTKVGEQIIGFSRIHSTPMMCTSSVNATEQSFTSTKNIEVSLARVLPKSPVKWKKASPREIKYIPFPYNRHIEGEGIIDATLYSDGQLVGIVQAVDFFSGPIKIELLQGGECIFEIHDVVLVESGKFECRIDTKFTEIHASLQIRIFGRGFKALGWISNELQLEATETDRQKMAAVSNGIRSDVEE
ncbi:MAG TPA: hypothetical protein VMT94_08295 [Burkholderiales bacterium]|nr:hypothetical protein [Burkholderiales bacterium]